MFQFIRTADSTPDSTPDGARARTRNGGDDSSHVAEGAPAEAAREMAALDVAAVASVISAGVTSAGVTSAGIASASVGAPKARMDVSKLDRAGATASFLCAIHCAVMPLIVAFLPLLGLGFLASEPVEWALLAASAMLGSCSLCLGFRQHRSRRVFMVLGVALALLVAGRIFHEPHLGPHALHAHHYGVWGLILMVLGGLTMMSAHLLNHRLCHACQKCSASSCC